MRQARTAMGALLCTALIGCTTGGRGGASEVGPTTPTEFVLKNDSIVLIQGWVKNGLPDSAWIFSNSNGVVERTGSYVMGLPSGQWMYVLQADTFYMSWSEIQNDTYDLGFSVPSSFRYDANSTPERMRFVYNENGVWESLHVFVQAHNGHDQSDDHARKVRKYVDGNIDDTLSLALCKTVKVKDGKEFSDLEFVVDNCAYDSCKVRMVIGELNSLDLQISYSTNSKDYFSDFVVGGVVQSLSHGIEYLSDPRLLIESIDTCSSGLTE